MGVPGIVTASLFLCLLCRTSWSGSPCPSSQEILPCYCTNGGQVLGTIMICSGIDNSSQLMEATNAMKGLMVDKFLLLNSFHKQPSDTEEMNELEAQLNERETLPNQWMSALRVKELEIRHTFLSSCFLCNEPFSGQSDFLVSLSATHSSLDGHLCNTCNTRTKSVSLRELSRVPHLKFLDLSWNHIEVIDGMAFPVGLSELRKVILSNNKIKTIHDNAFSSINRLTDLDLSNNELTVISRKIFRPSSALETLDLSWNMLQALPEGIFSYIRNLKELRISYNQIEVLPANTWSRAALEGRIEKLDFRGNFLVCNCSTSWIRGFATKPTKLQGKCVYPPEVESQELKNILSTSFQSCP